MANANKLKNKKAIDSIQGQIDHNKEVIAHNEAMLEGIKEGVDIHTHLIAHAEQKKEYIDTHPIKVLKPINSYEEDEQWVNLIHNDMKFSAKRELHGIQQVKSEMEQKVKMMEEQIKRLSDETESLMENLKK